MKQFLTNYVKERINTSYAVQVSRSRLSHAVCRRSFGRLEDGGDDAYHIAVHEEGNRLSESTCEGNLAKLGCWISKTYGPARTRQMLNRSDRDGVAADILRTYYSVSPTCTELLDAITGPGASRAMRLSALRDALFKIERTGIQGIKSLADKYVSPVREAVPA